MAASECDAKEKSILETYPDKAQALKDYISSINIGVDIEENRGFLIGCLHKAQSIFGYLPEEVQLLVAAKLRLTLADVNGVITFYSFFTTTMPGENIISICTGTACFVKGADKILQKFEEKLLIKDGETSDNGKFSINSLRCVGACSLAPVVMVNGKVYGKVTPSMVGKIINEYTD